MALASFTVTSAIPADGALVPAAYRLHRHLQSAGLRRALDPRDWLVDGVPATAVAPGRCPHRGLDTRPASSFPGNRVLNTVVISADPATGQRVEDVSGADFADFALDLHDRHRARPRSWIRVRRGDVFSPAPYDLTEVVTFSEPMDTSLTTSSSFDLFGIILRSAHRGRVV